MSVITEKIVAPAKNFVVRHKTAVTVVVTATITTVACAAMARVGKEGTDTFIKEHGLWDEYTAQFEDPKIEA